MRWSVRFLVLAPVVLVLAGCSAVPGASSSPTSSAASMMSAPIDSQRPSPPPEPSSSEAAAPTEPTVDAVPIPSDTYARVVTNDLRVRSEPGVSDDSIKLEPLLQHGTRVVVLDGPVQASGYDWYLVQPTVPSDTAEAYPFGWIAAADHDGEPWLQPEADNCPPLPASAEELGELNQVASLFYEITCFRGQDITFRARVGLPEAQCGTEPPWGIDPAWLDSCRSSGAPELVSIDAPGGTWLRPRWAPGVDTGVVLNDATLPENWPIVEVTGKFDHPDAQTCRNRLNYDDSGWPEPDPARTILTCRMQFVVTSMREIEG